MHRRDEIVFELCEQSGVAISIVMSGGYAHDVEDTVDIHEATLRQAVALSRGESVQA